MIQSFRRVMHRLAGDDSGPVLVACSGGSDSMALAELTAEAAKIEGWKLILAHLDHGLRADAGERDHLAAWAERRGIEFISHALDLPESLASEPGNLEARARELRYAALECIAEECGARTVLTGHTADDQAETLWLWLLRGTGLRGLRGIAPVRPIRGESDIRLVRPLLDCTRVQLREYLQAKGTAWLDDPSNTDTNFRRNRIRHELIPYLRKTFDLDPVPGAARLGAQARDLSEFLDREIHDQDLEAEKIGAQLRLDRESLAASPAALASWTLSAALTETRAGGHLNLTRILDLNDRNATGKTLELGENISARFTSRHIFIGPADLPLPWDEEIPLHRFEPAGLTLPEAGNMRIGDWILRIRERSGGIEAPTGPEAAYFDRTELKGPLRLVNPQSGMRIRPMGANGGKSLADFLIDRKVPRPWRKHLVILLDAEDELLWVAGVARGERAPLESKTKSSLALDLERASS